MVTKNCSKRTLKFKKLPTPPPPTLKGKSSFFAPKSEIKSEKTEPTSSETKVIFIEMQIFFNIG